ncbi:MAG: FadR family transcriptional regulator [Sporichthyaceae bacterium]|nr:FadR family transcriptional regulator [Sporichthyaceae bacterium]
MSGSHWAQARPAFRRIRGGNAYEETVERLLQAVKLGQVPVGERLPSERELASALGVSRPTLRQAVNALVEAGYLESRRGRYGGAFVLPPQEWRRDQRDARQIAMEMGSDITDALLLREVLEPGAAALAAGSSHPTGAVGELRAALALERAVGVEDYRPADSRLHLAIVSLVGSRSLSAAVSDNRMRLNDLLDAIPLLPPNIVHSRAQHARIVRAVLSGRPDAARREMAGHLDATASLLRGFLT